MICRAQDFSPVRGGPFSFAILSERLPIQRIALRVLLDDTLLV